jgi:hypothetical protein
MQPKEVWMAKKKRIYNLYTKTNYSIRLRSSKKREQSNNKGQMEAKKETLVMNAARLSRPIFWLLIIFGSISQREQTNRKRKLSQSKELVDELNMHLRLP